MFVLLVLEFISNAMCMYIALFISRKHTFGKA